MDGFNNIYYQGKEIQRIRPVIERAIIYEQQIKYNSQEMMDRLLNSKWEGNMSLERMKSNPICRVVVFYRGTYYNCLLQPGKVKCGRCLFGLINPYAIKSVDDKCRRCGAALVETVAGTKEENMESYRP